MGLDRDMIEAGVLNEGALATMRGMLAVLQTTADQGEGQAMLSRLALFGSRAAARIHRLPVTDDELARILLAHVRLDKSASL